VVIDFCYDEIMGHAKGIDPERNGTSRLEAFSDAILAVVITIMVLALSPPHGDSLGDLKPLVPKLLVYILSFTFLGIYWNNHHKLFSATRSTSAAVMWANLYLLFWLSLIPAITAWVGEHPRAAWPAAIYGIVAIMAAIAYSPVLTRAIIRADRVSQVAKALGPDLKGRISIVLYLLAIVMAFVNPLLSYAFYALVAAIWFIPDRRL
jgi:uncharacterized membrane protein